MPNIASLLASFAIVAAIVTSAWAQQSPSPTVRIRGAIEAFDGAVLSIKSRDGSDIKVRAFSHALGESGATFFAREDKAQQLKRGFPKSLDKAPALLQSPSTSVRRQLDQWFDKVGVRPHIVGEFDDSPLATLSLVPSSPRRISSWLISPKVWT